MCVFFFGSASWHGPSLKYEIVGFSSEAKLVAHLNASGLTLLDRLKDLISALSRWQLDLELCDTFRLPLDVQVFNLHFETCRQSL